MLGQSSAFVAIEQLIARMALYDVPVLLEGETGTGKELAARAIHYRGPRRERPFVPVNCGALPDSLIESELFGCRRGAFTGASDDRPGLVALAHTGTLFLDEVDSLTPKAQVTLLRFLQDQHYRPLGARREERADVRIVAASNRPLETLVPLGQFRLDLLYRLTLMHLRMPPLRERAGDIPLLASHFVETGARRFGRQPRPLAAETLAWFDRYHWPGNIRELEHLVYHGLLLSDQTPLAIAPPASWVDPQTPSDGPLTYGRAKRQAIARFEHTYLTRLIDQTDGNISVAARIAGTERRHLGRLLKKHRLGKNILLS